ncbi:BnaC08g42840D [Brassica napus]|uniref:BnaC08g42840D protein n=4 Tax=Brassica TaxID=3705 RepID=A0A078G859_BRANA|nr:BnaC08g42840D [Brassica napus]
MEETAIMDDSSDVEFACGDSQVEPRVGDEFQAKIPPLMSASKRASFLSTPMTLNDSSFPFLVGQPLQVTWIDKHPKQQGSEDGDDDDDVDMNQSLKSLIAKRKRRSRYSDKHSVSKKQRLSLEPLPEIQSIPWEDLDVASFVLGLYTFGKNFTQVKNFTESKGTREIVLFYYGKFYNSARYNSWSHSRKKRNRRCVFGRKLYSGWRQQQLLSRLIPSVSNESQRHILVNVSKSFSEGNITLEKYVSTVKGIVGLRLLVEAVAIGKAKEDLTTVLTSGPKKAKPSSVPGLGGAAYTSLTSAEIVNQLKGTSRLSKARCNDIFWEAVWLRLLARGWRSEQPKDHRGYNIVFIVPGVREVATNEAEANYHSVSGAPSLKRRRLSACIMRDKSLSREEHSPGDDTERKRREEDGSKETGSKPLVQIEDSEPSFLLNGENTESKASDRRQDSKPVVLTEHPKLPPIVWKLSFKRSRGASET